MVDAVTNNVALIIPATGADVGSWGTAVINVNMQALDGILGGFATISLAAATTIALTAPAGSLTPGAGPNQQSNAVLFFTGTLTGNAVIQLSVPRLYVMHNKCTVGTSYIQVAPSSGTGTAVGLPPGQKVSLYFDGTNVDYCDTLPVGAKLELIGATAIPAWMNACSTAPFLIMDGSIYTSSIYPQLSAMLGSTFGGNGITTFAVPDARSRVSLPFDNIQAASNATAARITAATAGFPGNVMGTSGGDQRMQSHNHTGTVTIINQSGIGVSDGGQTVPGNGGASFRINVLGVTASMAISNTGLGGSQNVQPAIVDHLPLIKTG